MQTKIFILYTGGTIGMAPKDANDPSSPLAPKPLSELINYIPGAADVDKPEKYLGSEAKQLAATNAKIDQREDQTLFIEYDNGNLIILNSASFENPVDSSDVGPEHWRQMAQMIEQAYDEHDGFIILHGTDTMAYTSSALSFIFENLAKPVVITGSQLPIAATRTDAPLNFINAVHIAGYKATDLPLVPEVVIAFADKILRGCRASKVSSSDWAGFDSPNFPLLGTIGEYIKINANCVLRPPEGNKKFFIKTDLVEKVFHLNVFPGFTHEQVRKIVKDEDAKGIILRTYGTGNVPGDDEFLEILGSAINDGDRMVVNLSQCQVGTVEMGLYEASSGLMERGVISGLDMTPEAALTKMMWTLGTQFGDGRTLQMQISQRGEQTENLLDLRFGKVSQEEAKDTYTNAVSPDGRLDRNRISSSMLRISDLGVMGANVGDRVKLHVFMNMPSAGRETSLDENRRVASFNFVWDGEASTRMQNITHATQNVIGSGDVILTLVGESPDIKLYFSGLYIALYAKA